MILFNEFLNRFKAFLPDPSERRSFDSPFFVIEFEQPEDKDWRARQGWRTPLSVVELTNLAEGRLYYVRIPPTGLPSRLKSISQGYPKKPSAVTTSPFAYRDNWEILEIAKSHPLYGNRLLIRIGRSKPDGQLSR